MKFAIQQNLMNDEQLFLTGEATKNYPRTILDVVPFTREIKSDVPLIGKEYIPYGSTLLTKLAKDLGWTGLHFDLELFNYRASLKNRKDMLNDNVLSAKEAVEFLEKQNQEMFFVRPSDDNKQFAGQVMPADEIASWFQSMFDAVGGGSYYMPPETEIVLSSVKEISAEWRWFIVDGKIVSGSMYRAHKQLRKIREQEKSVIEEAQQMADIWLPDSCCVMDTCLIEGKMKVVEFNCLNSSGFYNHDVNLIFKSLWDYHERKCM
jgi:hypothetical protein